MFNHRIYLDYASLTPIDKHVLRVMNRYSTAKYANPSSWYKEGIDANEVMKNARTSIADHIHAHADEIIFTSGGTEANNIAIFGAIEYLKKTGTKYQDMHVLYSSIEHSSVLECMNELSRRGVNIEAIGVSSAGVVSVDDIKKKIRSNTVLISVMTVNNEIGSIQPIRDIGKIVRKTKNAKKYPLFHTDASQSMYVDINMEQIGVDMMTIDGSKIYGPRGNGFLYVRRQTDISPIIFGGGQESGQRSGTENLPAIMGISKAFDMVISERSREISRITELRNYFIRGLQTFRNDITVNGDVENLSPHIINISIPNVDNEFLVIKLDAKGVACSTKSSCLRDAKESYVLRAIGAHSATSIRFSFGRQTRVRDIVRAVRIITRALTD